jgi:hypothetical protein
MKFVLFQVKEAPTIVIKEASPLHSGPETNVSSAPGILNNAAEIP